MSYKIKDGDTLSGIAKANNTTVDAILESNPSIKNPNLIKSGQSINLPSSSAYSQKTGGGSLPVTGTKVGSTTGSQAQTSAPKSEAQSYKEIYDSLMAEGYQSSYTGQWGEKRDTAIGEYENLGDFEYDIDSDIVYQQLADEYERSGRMAMEDTLGKAAAYTGGYGSSYGTQAGQQAFNSHMQELSSMIPELEARAYERDQAERQELLNLISMYRDLDTEDYGRDRDARADWQDEVDDAYTKYVTERDYDFSQKQYEDSLKAQEIDILLALGDYDTLDSLGYDTSSLRAQQAAELASAYAKASGSSGGDDESVMLWNYSKTQDDNNNYIYYGENGKKNAVPLGVNPYNGEINKDILDGNGMVDESKLFRKESTDENGNTVYTYSNTYQPNNIDGKPLTKTGQRYNMNGRDQAIWRTPDGTEWVWDGTQNKYLRIEYED